MLNTKPSPATWNAVVFDRGARKLLGRFASRTEAKRAVTDHGSSTKRIDKRDG